MVLPSRRYVLRAHGRAAGAGGRRDGWSVLQECACRHGRSCDHCGATGGEYRHQHFSLSLSQCIARLGDDLVYTDNDLLPGHFDQLLSRAERW